MPPISRSRRRLGERQADLKKDTPKKPSLLGGVISKDVGSGGRHSRPQVAKRRSEMPSPLIRREYLKESFPAAGTPKRSARRRYNLATGAAMTEIRLPSLPRVRLGERILSFFLLCVALVGLYLLFTLPEFQVDSPQLHGLKFVDGSEVKRALAMHPQPIFMVDGERMREVLLETFPEFSEVVVEVQWPNTLLISVTERTPVLIWQQDEQAIYVDEQGRTFLPRPGSIYPDLPVVHASGPPPPLPRQVSLSALLTPTPSPSPTPLVKSPMEQEPVFVPAVLLESEMVTAILTLAAQLPEGARLIYEPAHGFGWEDRRGWFVYLGDLSDLEMKLSAYRKILEHIKASGQRPAVIGLEFVDAPYYRLQE